MLLGTESGDRGTQLVEQAALMIKWCFPASILTAAITTTPRDDGSSGAQVFELLSQLPPGLINGAAAVAPGANGGANGTVAAASNSSSRTSSCVSGTAAAPPLDRCYALMGLFVDYVGSAYERSSSGRLEKAGYYINYKQAVWLCEGVVDEDCIKTYGPVGCVYNYFGVGIRANGSSSVGASAAQSTAAAAAGTSSSPAASSPASSTPDGGVVAGAAVGSVAGALLVGAAIWAIAVRRRGAQQRRQLEQQRQDSDVATGLGPEGHQSLSQQQQQQQQQLRGAEKGDVESVLPVSVGHSDRDASSSQGTGYESAVALTQQPCLPTHSSPAAQQHAAHSAELGDGLAAADVVTEFTPRRPSISLITAGSAAPPADGGGPPGLKGTPRLAALTAALDKGGPSSAASRASAASGGGGGGPASVGAPPLGGGPALSEAGGGACLVQQPQQPSVLACDPHRQQGEDQRGAEQAEDATGVVASLNVTLVPNGLLGKGSFGRVYRGRYQGREVAVKVFSSEFVTEGSVNDKEVVDSLCAEVEVLSRVDHPNIVKLLAVCLTPPRFCLVMELMQLNLAQLLHGDIGRVCTCGAQGSGTCSPYCPMSSRVLPLVMVLDIAIDIARALSYLHPTISHRDLKPANVLLTWSDAGEAPATSAASACSGGSGAASGGVSRGGRRGRMVAKLSDFGISRMSHTLRATITPEAGTPAYIAPENFNPGNWLVSCKSDMYAYGVLLWELITGLEPWKGIPVARIAYRVTLLRERLPLEVIDLQRPEPVPARLSEIVAACFDDDPQRRPAAAELANELESIRATVLEQQRCRLEAEAARRQGSGGPAPGPAGPWG
ncbi:hypothetical protein HYH02_011383 [Chlamydomonas schloesseri]|uniref:Protein kinase domain-containing protein n=1 Tax=Chlamydomonas schloesseri TaxID=2026947 RepID=A0A835W1I5_9CHLO|nr:hypothetical protein HYH02_011383 [Chlamydomonas schloesseri]|eukprot:KAG2437127.1 hypothetical protein HYH02_011383 [Chlamydomonas schloesseri]